MRGVEVVEVALLLALDASCVRIASLKPWIKTRNQNRYLEGKGFEIVLSQHIPWLLYMVSLWRISVMENFTSNIIT